MKLIDHIKHLLGPPATPPHMAEFMAAAERVGEAARKAGVEDIDDAGPFGNMAVEMRNGPHATARKRKRVA